MTVIISANEAARILSVHPTTVAYMVRTKTLKAVSTKPHLRLALQDVERLRIARESKTKVGRKAHGIELTGGK